MNADEFSPDQWQDVFENIRLLVIRAGYADWDANAFEALAEESDDSDDHEGVSSPTMRPALEEMRNYVDAFRRFLKVRSRHTLDFRRTQLASLVQTEDGAPVNNFLVEVDGLQRPIFEDDDNPDAMIQFLGQFLNEISGEDGHFWDPA